MLTRCILGDPGELFDVDLGEHGFLALSDEDTSVMLIDCARMASVWTLAQAQRQRRSFMEAKARKKTGLYGPLERMWHARDTEYVPHQSKLLHYTAIHMQPWQPTPHRYVYQHNPVGEVWCALERAANAAAYQVSLPRTPANNTKRYARRSVRPANPRPRRRNSEPVSISRGPSSKTFPGMTLFRCRRQAVSGSRCPKSSQPMS